MAGHQIYCCRICGYHVPYCNERIHTIRCGVAPLLEAKSQNRQEDDHTESVRHVDGIVLEPTSGNANGILSSNENENPLRMASPPGSESRAAAMHTSGDSSLSTSNENADTRDTAVDDNEEASRRLAVSLQKEEFAMAAMARSLSAQGRPNPDRTGMWNGMDMVRSIYGHSRPGSLNADAGLLNDASNNSNHGDGGGERQLTQDTSREDFALEIGYRNVRSPIRTGRYSISSPPVTTSDSDTEDPTEESIRYSAPRRLRSMERSLRLLNRASPDRVSQLLSTAARTMGFREEMTFEEMMSLDDDFPSRPVDRATYNKRTHVSNIASEQRFDESGEPERCAICLGEYQEYDNVRSLPCKHFFHVDCIDTHCRTKRTCPVCRSDIS